MDTLRFTSFGEQWEQGLPIGNGRIAAMVWGAQDTDCISLNHEWLWSGDFKDRECEEGAHFLPYVRDYLKKGQNFKATALAAIAFGGNGGISPLKRRMDSYKPAGDILLHHPHADKVERRLELNGGVVQSEKKTGQGVLKLESFCHGEREIFAARWTAEKPMDVCLEFARPQEDGVNVTLEMTEQGLCFCCDGGSGIAFQVKVRWETDARVTLYDGKAQLSGMTYLVLWGNIGSSHAGIEQELARAPLGGDFDELLCSQRQLFAQEMRRNTLELWDDGTDALTELSVEERKQRVAEGKPDAQLAGLFARFGVYLMVAGSLCAELPLNLQGKWNHELIPKWNSDYHLNINLQMNYWFTDTLCMDRYSRQMTDYVLRLLPKARIAAQRMYGCRGVVYPLNSDIWANVTAEAYNYAVWIAGAGWLASHFWRSWQHTGDDEYLRSYAYPFFREAARFYEDYIVIDEQGVAQLMPSQSPENKYEGCGYFPVSMCISSAMDVQVAYEALTYASEAAQHLGVDAEDAVRWEELRDRLPDFRIGKDGRLLEWDTDDKIEVEKGHRHVSHLYGVYPASLFTPEQRRAQFDAARRSLEYRLAHSGGYTGWSSAWSACLYARFLDGEKVLENLRHLMTKQSSRTLLDLHPDFYPASRNMVKKPSDEPLLFTAPEENPPMIFQIDGNMGATAAVLEALVQYRGGVIFLLPAVPEEWQHGRVAGVRVPGGHCLEFAFDEGTVTECTVILGPSGRAELAGFGENGSILEVNGAPGSRVVVCQPQ